MQSPKRLKKICDLETSAYSILDIAVKLEVKRISIVKFKSVIRSAKKKILDYATKVKVWRCQLLW